MFEPAPDRFVMDQLRGEITYRIGTRILKYFGKKLYVGTVVAYTYWDSPTGPELLYRIYYNIDGDYEDMDEEQVDYHHLRSSLRSGHFSFAMRHHDDFDDFTITDSDGTSSAEEDSESSLFLSENELQSTWVAENDSDFEMDNESTDLSE